MLVVTTFTSGLGFGLVDIRHKKVVGNATAGRKGHDSKAVIHTIHGTTFCEQHIAKLYINIFNVSAEVNCLHKYSSLFSNCY
jgi:hypothetical protein